MWSRIHYVSAYVNHWLPTADDLVIFQPLASGENESLQRLCDMDAVNARSEIGSNTSAPECYTQKETPSQKKKTEDTRKSAEGASEKQGYP